MSATLKIPAARSNPLSLFPFLLLFTAAWQFLPTMSPFGVMCGIALSLFFLIKLHTLLHFVHRHNRTPDMRDIAAWFIAWPGMDAPAFFPPARTIDSPVHMRDWGLATVKTVTGLALWTEVAPALLPVSELAAGWIALIGIAFCLHFGLFHLLALYWQHRGRAVLPIMDSPIRATSLQDFWSHRWNRAFRDYAHFAVFAPLAARMSPSMALSVGYLFSGVLHELAISVPAGAGYGLPTLYFAVQGLGILVERRYRRSVTTTSSALIRWLWTAVVLMTPAWLLFHAPFIHRVVIPIVSPFAD